MTEQVEKKPPSEAEALFNAAVEDALDAYAQTVTRLMNEVKIPPVAVALAAALSSTDLTVALAVEMGQSPEQTEKALEDLFDDMKSRALLARPLYEAKLKELRANEAGKSQEEKVAA